MKKLSLLITGILIGAFATYYFCPSCSVKSDEVVAEKSLMKLAGVITPNQAKILKYDVNGVRMYLSAHADSGSTVSYTTVFMVPTGNSIGGPTTGKGDIPNAYGLNTGVGGQPSSANYLQ